MVRRWDLAMAEKELAWLAYARYGVYARLAYANLAYASFAYASQIDPPIEGALGGFIYAAS
jgi:hypothetical protein